MMKRAAMLAAMFAWMPFPACASDAPPAEASAPLDEAPMPQPTTARRVIEAQLRQPPRPVQRQQSRIERERLIERYAATLGAPIQRRAASGSRPR